MREAVHRNLDGLSYFIISLALMIPMEKKFIDTQIFLYLIIMNNCC